MRRERRNYTTEEKVAILRRHLVEKEAISKLCDEQGLQPTVFYRRQITVWRVEVEYEYTVGGHH